MLNFLFNPLNGFMRAAKRVCQLLLKSFVMISAVRSSSTSQPNIMECHGNYSEAFSNDAMQAFISAIPHVCNESVQFLKDFVPSPLLKNFTLLKLTSGTVSSVDFTTGERKNSQFAAQDNSGQDYQIVSPDNEKIFVANIHGHQKDELCGKFMKLKCS